MLTVGHERGCLQLGMREDAYSWARERMLTVGHERMLTVGHERECLQLGKREDVYSWA